MNRELLVHVFYKFLTVLQTSPLKLRSTVAVSLLDRVRRCLVITGELADNHQNAELSFYDGDQSRAAAAAATSDIHESFWEKKKNSRHLSPPVIQTRLNGTAAPSTVTILCYSALLHSCGSFFLFLTPSARTQEGANRKTRLRYPSAVRFPQKSQRLFLTSLLSGRQCYV